MGDRVQGTATLHAYAGDLCIECGAYVRRQGCAGTIGYRNANDETKRAYGLILEQMPENSRDYVEVPVQLSGVVLASAIEGKLAINADRLARVK